MTEIAQQTLQEHLAEVARKSSTPGGSAVATVSATKACALISMIANLTKADLSDILSRAKASRSRLLELADEDGVAFAAVMATYDGKGDLEPALMQAAQVPISAMEICIAHLEDLALLAEPGNRKLTTDVAIAACPLRSALECCRFNVRSMKLNTSDFVKALASIDCDVDRCDLISKKILKELA